MYYDGDQLVNKSFSTRITVYPRDISLTVTRSLLDSDIYVGEVVDVNYVIQNKDSKSIQNISFIYPKSDDYDHHSKKYTIGSLSPNEREEIVLEKIRLKDDVNTRVLGPNITFQDEDGVNYLITTNIITVKPANTNVVEPLYLINRSYDGKTVTDTIKNLGDASGSADLFDIKTYKMSFAPFQEKAISYQTGSPDIEPVSLAYEFNGFTFYSYSNTLVLPSQGTTTTTTIATTTTLVTTTSKATTTTNDDPVLVEKEVKETKKKGFFGRIIDRLKSIFSFIDIKKGEE
jgi:hypothetical protein